MGTVVENITAIKKIITHFEEKYGREKGSVRLLAVSKGQSVEKILEALEARQYRFCENYLQEALLKMKTLVDKPIEWHYIGKIQSNKTRKIAEQFSWVQSVGDMKIAKRLNDQRPAHLPQLNICIEVNVDNEASKSGCKIDNVVSLARYCLSLPRLKLRGLMAIPAEKENFIEQCIAFHTLFSLWQSLQTQGIPLDALSMGMSNDFEAAISEGATCVRIGTAIFGKRQTAKHF